MDNYSGSWKEKALKRDQQITFRLTGIKHCHRVYFFDNSADISENKEALVAEINPDRELHFHTPQIPGWLKTYLLDKL